MKITDIKPLGFIFQSIIMMFIFNIFDMCIELKRAIKFCSIGCDVESGMPSVSPFAKINMYTCLSIRTPHIELVIPSSRCTNTYIKTYCINLHEYTNVYY